MDFKEKLEINNCIKRIKHGDKDKAVTDLYYAINGFLKFNALKYFDNEQDIQDAISEFWLNIINYCCKMPFIDNGRAYLVKCFENLCLEKIRKDRKHREVLSLDQSVAILNKCSTFADDEDLDNKIIIESALNALEEVERNIVYKIDYIEYTTREVAQQLGISKSQVSRIHKRALDKIGKFLDNNGTIKG